jgi:hypothetical protein
MIVECRGERIKVVSPKTAEGGLVIHRELPVLNGEGSGNN